MFFRSLILLLIIMLPFTATAHAPITGFGDFYAGLLHPVTAMEHLVPLIALALLAGQQGKSVARISVVMVPLLMLMGGVAAQFTDQLTLISWVNRISFIIIGGLVAWGGRMPRWHVNLLVAGFSFTHGYENMAGIESQVAFFIFTAGMMICGLLIISLFSAFTTTLQKSWQRIGVRVAGSWTAAIGLLIVGLQIVK